MKCSLCSSANTVEFLNLGEQPLANKYPLKEQIDKEDFFPLRVFFCAQCKNVQLGTMVSRVRMFEDYYYLSSVSPALVRHFQEFANGLLGSKFVVDVGSNDGVLLKPLKDLGVRCVGVEPSINVSKIANDQGLPTIVSFFDQGAVEKIITNWGKPDVIVASSVFTHLEDPHEFIENVKKLITEDGKFIIEVEYIADFLKGIQFERFYLDRILYYSLTSLVNLFALHEMSVTDVEEIEPHGGSLRVFVQKKETAQKPSSGVERILEKESKILTASSLAEFARAARESIAAFRRTLEEYKHAGLRVAGYGAPARVSTICNYGNIGPSLIEFIVDDSPLKQNRFSPGKHIPIVSREHLENQKPDILVVFAYECFDDIKEKTKGAYKYLIPIPPREVVGESYANK